MSEDRRAWDADSMGFGKHSYRHVDPATVNPADFAKNLRGEEENFGDVRQYNSAYNEKHPENDVDLDWVTRIGTVIETDAEGWEGLWYISNLPVVKAPEIFCRAVKVESAKDEPSEDSKEVVIPTYDLGCSVGPDNMFKQVKTKLVKRGAVDRTQRPRIVQRS